MGIICVIEARELTKIYKSRSRQVVALDGVSFSVEKGEFLIITGPSGSGKSTLMNIIGCLDKPSSGQYFLNGKDVSLMKGRELTKMRNRSIGFIFQNCDLIASLNATENVWLPLLYRGTSLSERKKAALNALEMVGLSSRATHLPRELSGGQRQRVAIARALATNPDIILADEPTGSLDSKIGREIIAILKSLAYQGSTVIVITHDDSLAKSADRMITIRDGRAN